MSGQTDTRYFPVILCLALLTGVEAVWGGESTPKFTLPKGEELEQGAVEKHIGRMGEVEAVPENFSFSRAEASLWRSNHLENITEPMQLYYEFIKDGSFEEGFSDSVYLSILELNEDGTKNANMEFFTGERKQNFNSDNVTNVLGNPVLGIYMQGDVYEMARLTEGSWRHFHKRIKVALREVARVEPVTITYDGRELAAEKISFNPYLNDPHRSRFRKFSNKIYEITFAEDVPGKLYQIRTVIEDQEANASGPLMEEVLTLVSSKPLER